MAETPGVAAVGLEGNFCTFHGKSLVYGLINKVSLATIMLPFGPGITTNVLSKLFLLSGILLCFGPE